MGYIDFRLYRCITDILRREMSRQNLHRAAVRTRASFVPFLNLFDGYVRFLQLIEHAFNRPRTCEAFLWYFVLFASVTEIPKIVLAYRRRSLLDSTAKPSFAQN